MFDWLLQFGLIWAGMLITMLIGYLIGKSLGYTEGYGDATRDTMFVYRMEDMKKQSEEAIQKD